MPNGKFPREIAKRLGFDQKQLEASLIIDQIGNPYSASALLGLAKVLDQAQADKLILMVSYGSGAGADAFVIKTNKTIIKKRNIDLSFDMKTKSKQYISYLQYLKNTRKI